MSTAAWGERYAHLKERRDELFRELGMRYFGKAFNFRDMQRFIGEYQAAEGRLVPNPYDRQSPSVQRGKLLYGNLSVSCSVWGWSVRLMWKAPKGLKGTRKLLYSPTQSMARSAPVLRISTSRPAPP